MGAYEIVSLLGRGGMGEVYRARDTRLKRDVAIKALPEALRQDADRLSRLIREAQVLASLNHPNIAHVHGFEESGETPCIVMELVDGQTLQNRLNVGRIPLAEALPIADQIAKALEAAHEKGIIHRDLKPANIKLTPDGVVKVLDFGLAKQEVRSEQGVTDLANRPTLMNTQQTRAGEVVGTAGYMSPEQARGLEIDKRTDIFAFGCVLYEMLTGRAPFSGDTAADAIAAILNREPDWHALPESIPDTLRRLLVRCLEKDRKRRFRDMGDVGIALEDATTAPAPVRITSSKRRGWLVAAFIILAAAGGFVASRFMRREEPGGLADATIRQLTRDAGLTRFPALSQDGKLVAYASTRAGRGDLDIWVQQTSGGSPLRLTNDAADDLMPDFSHDGSQVVFHSERSNGGVYIVPALAGSERLIAPDGRQPHFSPDDKQIAYWGGQWRGTPSSVPSAAYTLSLSGGNPVRILPGFALAREPIWSPDGKSLLVLARADQTSPLAQVYDWWWVPLDGRGPAKSGVLDLRDFRAQADEETLRIGAWTEAGVVLADRDSVWMVPLSKTSGHVSGPPQRIVLGAGHRTIFRSVATGRSPTP